MDFIFAHHPVMFKPAKDLDTRNPQNAMYAKLLAHQITVYAAHTNLDTANGGMNDWLADQLGLNNTTPLVEAGYDPITGQPVGMGRIGDLKESLSVSDFAKHCLTSFGGDRLTGGYADTGPPRRSNGWQFWGLGE